MSADNIEIYLGTPAGPVLHFIPQFGWFDVQCLFKTMRMTVRGYGGDRSSNLVMTILAGYESCQYRATQS